MASKAQASNCLSLEIRLKFHPIDLRGEMAFHVSAVKKMPEEELVAVEYESVDDQRCGPFHFVVQGKGLQGAWVHVDYSTIYNRRTTPTCIFNFRGEE